MAVDEPHPHGDLDALDLDVDALVEEEAIGPPGEGATPCDVVLLVPGWSEIDDWVGRKILYVPQRPRGTDPGARVYLCRERSLFYSYRIDGFLDLQESLPAGTTEGDEGWAIQVSDGRPIDRPLDDIEDPSGVVTRWVQGFRYVAPGGTVFVRSPRYRAVMPVKEPKERAVEPTSAAEATPVTEHVPFWRRWRR
jgi:hypothetical protein